MAAVRFSVYELSLEDELRFFSLVPQLPSDVCWPFPHQAPDTGYGLFFANGHQYRAHRVALYLRLRRPIHRLVRHSCDNPPCVNPAHLLEGSDADNMLDKVVRGRARGAAKGAAHHNARLTPEAVREIRARPETSIELAPLYGVTARTIRDVRERRRWAHLDAAKPSPDAK